MVTPLAGVWIEMQSWDLLFLQSTVTPLAGVWIEIDPIIFFPIASIVTPLAGVWIEIAINTLITPADKSLPLRECGLKY